jgi:hypothetical protein
MVIVQKRRKGGDASDVNSLYQKWINSNCFSRAIAPKCEVHRKGAKDAKFSQRKSKAPQLLLVFSLVFALFAPLRLCGEGFFGSGSSGLGVRRRYA